MMLESLFLTVLEISVAVAPVILLLLLVSPLLSKRYTPSLRCIIWLALAIRLILPVNMPWQHAFQINLFPTLQPQTAQTGWFLPNPAVMLENESTPEAGNAENMQEQERNSPKSIKTAPLALLAAAWATGTAIFLLYHIGAYFYTLRRLRRWSTPVCDEEMLNKLNSVKQKMSIRGKVKLYRSAKAASPLLVGFIRPRVMLSERPLAPEQLELMLYHELWHLKRRDLWRKLLMLFANAIHWFNPFVWLLDRRACLDAELACDADVLREADSGTRKEYGYVVLSYLEQGWRCNTPLTSRFYGGKKQMKQRFYNIADTSAKKRGTLIFCAIAVIIVLAGCAVNATNTIEQSQPKYSSQENADKFDMKVSAFVPDETVPETVNSAQELSHDITDTAHDNIEWSKDPYTGGEMAWPLPGNTRIIQPYGLNARVTPNDMHTGLDIAGEQGDPIIAANDGTVAKVNLNPTPGIGYGMYVIIDHGGEISTLYAHCSKILVKEGESVTKGTYIAEAGTTGYAQEPHLHFEVRLSGMYVDPIPYITSSGFMWPASGGHVAITLYGYQNHTGIDIGGIAEGSPVYAAASGTVVKVIDGYTGYGKHIIIDHGNGYQTLYAHNSELYVSVGDVVAKGQTIAAVGRSGNTMDYALHFEIRHNGEILNPQAYVTAPDMPEDLPYSPSSNPLDYAEYDLTQNDGQAAPPSAPLYVSDDSNTYTAHVDGSGATYTVEINGNLATLTPIE